MRMTLLPAALTLALCAQAADPVHVFGPARVEEVYRVLLDRDALLLESIARIVKEKGIDDGQVLVSSGSVSECVYHYVKSTAQKPVNGIARFTGAAEILNAAGVIAAGEPHIHITLSTPAKGAFGGHLENGCKILYVAEVTIVKYSGPPLTRKLNENGVSISPGALIPE